MVEATVNEEASASIVGKLMFSFVLPVITKTSAIDVVDIQDLPAAPAALRTQNILHQAVQFNDRGGMRASLGPTTSLLWTVWAPQWMLVLKGQILTNVI